MARAEVFSFKRVSQDEIKGWMREDILRLFPSSFFKDPVCFVEEMGGEVVKESRRRWAAIFSFANGPRLFLKRDRTIGWRESLKYLLLPSKARKEWSVAYLLEKKNLAIPKPLGWMEKIHRGLVKEGYYLSEAIGSGISLIEDPVKLGDPFVLLEMARTVKKIHHTGLFHKDLHAGNFLWNGQSLYLTDLHSTKIVKTLSLSKRLWNLALLFNSLRYVWGEKYQSLFLDVYFEGESLHFRRKEELLQRIHFHMDRLQKRQWRSRTKRCLKESTEFSIQREKGAHYYHRRDFSLDKAKKLIEEHLRLVKENPSALVKNAPEVSVSLLEDEGRKVCVKHIRNLNFWRTFKDHFRRPKGLKAWVGSNGLRARAIPSLEALALVEKRRWWGLKESFFLMESFETGQEMDRYILEKLGDPQKKRFFTKAFAQWLSSLHQKRVFHRDMKTCNILISENKRGWDFYLLDQEDISLNVKVDFEKLFRTFLQLNTSTPGTVSRKDRFRFFNEYFRLNPIIKDRKSFSRHLIDESKRRELVYVAPWGVVTEKL
jgi:tRNA A-37 threonylcarbamoyl transferase component Bud32